MEKEMNIHQRIASIKKELQKSALKKTGYNKFTKSYYYELSDVLPRIIELNEEYGINDTFDINNESAHLSLSTNNSETSTTTIPFVMAEMQASVDPIQKLGATITYLRRYLYLTAYGIADTEVIITEEKVVITQEELEETRAKMLLWLNKEVPNKDDADKILTDTLIKYGCTDVKQLDFNKVNKIEFFDTLTAKIKTKKEKF